MNQFVLSVIPAILLTPVLAIAQSGEVRLSEPDEDALALSEIVGDEFIAENVRDVRRHAVQRAPADRFDFLAAWVLPGNRHRGFRVSGEFTRTDPPPLENRDESDGPSRGGELTSPVFDLLDVAAQTGRLDELRRKITGTPEPEAEFQQRARAALLLLVNLELGDRSGASAAARTLHALIAQESPQFVADMWPETLAVYRGLLRFGALPEIGDLLISIYARRTSTSTPRGVTHWHSHIASLLERYNHLMAGESPASLDSAAELRDWVPISRGGAQARGSGSPVARWHRSADNEIHHLSGLNEDFLFFRTPLRGDFEVEGDIGSKGTTQFYAAGRYFGPRANGGVLETGTFRSGAPFETIDPPLTGFDDWVRFRVVFEDGVRRVYLNGQLVHSETLPEHHDPWIGVRSWSTYPAKFRNVQVTGHPDIPDAVLLSASRDLAGWRPYSGESVGYEGAIWQSAEDPESSGQIHARLVRELTGTCFESTLCYHRPLDEHASIEYDFFYEPGQVEVHPALNRLAFVLDPRGVRIHWITDAEFDPGDLRPDNVFDEPQHRRGPEELPLAEGDWNHVRLSLAGGTATLELNGRPVYQRGLESTLPQTFGLFRYAGRTEVRVRNIVMTGDWPRQIPPPPAQEIADHVVASLDADLPRLRSVFAHDFAKEGIADEFFFPTASDQAGDVVPESDGLHVVRPTTDGWSSVGIKLRFAAIGDFDIEAAFDAFQPRSDKQASIMLLALLDDDEQHRCRVSRMLKLRQLQQVNAAVSIQHQGNNFTYDTRLAFCEATAGRLRLARRGNVMHFLFAENDSPVFRLLRSEEVSDRPLVQDRLALLTDCNGTGETRVVWKSITLRAEQLKYLPPNTVPAERKLFFMNSDGSGLRELTGPPDGFSHIGSPEWSPDGRRIALDASTGATTTSHIIVVDTDNGEATDLGPGCMPSFSRDARQVVFSQPGAGVMMMNADGSDRRIIDRAGWGVQFSPDGKSIAYGKAGNVTLRDVATGNERELLHGKDATRYDEIYWNLGWSHDGRSIAFKGRNSETGADELAVADVDSPESFQVLYSTTGSLNNDFTWSPDNKRVLFAMRNPALQAPSLYFCSRNQSGPPTLLPEQPGDLSIYGGAWSSDDRITFTGERIPQAVDWPTNSEPSE